MATAGKRRGFIRSIFQTVYPDYHTFVSVDHRLWETGTSAVNRHRTGQGRWVRTLQIDEDILQCFETNAAPPPHSPCNPCTIGHAVGAKCCTGAAAPSLLLAEGVGSRPQQLPWLRPICALVCTPECTEAHFLQCGCSWMRLASTGRRFSTVKRAMFG
jgi:hypothetical protein